MSVLGRLLRRRKKLRELPIKHTLDISVLTPGTYLATAIWKGGPYADSQVLTSVQTLEDPDRIKLDLYWDRFAQHMRLVDRRTDKVLATTCHVNPLAYKPLEPEPGDYEPDRPGDDW